MTCATIRFACLSGLIALLLIAGAPDLLGQTPSTTLKRVIVSEESHVASAGVVFDGRVLFRVAAVPAYTAEERAEVIAARIHEFADDLTVPPVAVRVMERSDSSDVMAGLRLLVSVVDADAALEGVERARLAEGLATKVRQAIIRYRSERTPEELWRSAGFAAAASLFFAIAVILVLWAARRLNALVEGRLSERIPSVQVQSYQILGAGQIWGGLKVIAKVVGLLLFLATAYVYLQFVLGLFPWTRPVADRLLEYFLDPLAVISRAVAAEIPNLILIVLIVLITRYTLKAVRSFFRAIGRGSITFAGFDADWAMPTYKILRVGIVAFSVIVAYPYVPGSESAAFQGITIFLGIILSLGSTSVISNIIAGHTMTYRRAYKVGDRVKIQDTVGDVMDMHLLVTHLRSLKNEVVAVPNSLIMNSQVVNFSALAREQGLILHRHIGISYEVPWRQVEAMLLEAVGRCPGFLKDPPPFVLQQGFGEFSLTYEVNAYCADAGSMPALYTALDRSIIDVFKEKGVQIMTPVYVAEPQAQRAIAETDQPGPPTGTAALRHLGNKPA